MDSCFGFRDCPGHFPETSNTSLEIYTLAFSSGTWPRVLCFERQERVSRELAISELPFSQAGAAYSGHEKAMPDRPSRSFVCPQVAWVTRV